MKIKVDKNLIATYLSLDSKKADEYLANLANQIKAEVIASSDNDEILEYLILLEEFVYKAPIEIVKIANYIVGKEPQPATVSTSPLGEFEGKSHKDLVLKGIELLDRLRYIMPDEVLKLAVQLSLDEDSMIKGKALGIAKRFSQYDYNVLTKNEIGYGAQREALDFMLGWSRKKQIQYIDFVETVLKEILNPSINGTTSGLNEETQYTITFHSGVVSPTDFLKKMRREAIDLTYKLYKTTDDANLKLKLVGIFDEASRTPGNVLYGDDVSQMVDDDLRYISSIYRKIVFGDKGGKMTDHLGIVAFIEERLRWIHKSERRKDEESEKLRKDILCDELYHVFRLLVGDPIAYQEEEGWDTAEKTRNEEIDRLINSIETEQLEEWFDKLNRIASQHVIVENWKFNIFEGFLQKLSEKKPSIADNLINRALEEDSSLKHFVGGFLYGFRTGAHFGIWDKYVSKIISTEDISLISAITFSLNLPSGADLNILIRDEDINLLKNITRRDGQLSFLKKADYRVLQYALFNTLTRNFKRSPKEIEPLIVEEIRNYPKYLSIFFSELPMATHRKWIDVKELNRETIEFLREKMVEIPDVDWHVQGLLLEIGEQYGLDSVLNVFMKRIRKDGKKKEMNGRRVFGERYEVIPYHFNPGLRKFIVGHPDYIRIAVEWISKTTTKWSLYNWYVSRLFQRLGGSFEKIIFSLIQKGDNDSLLKAARAMHSIDGANLNLCIEIVRRTDNKRILSQIDSNMYTTGVVSGEYGLAEAYEKKVNMLEKYKTDENERVKKFADRMTNSFRDSAERERQRADEEKQLRKIEFEG